MKINEKSQISFNEILTLLQPWKTLFDHIVLIRLGFKHLILSTRHQQSHFFLHFISDDSSSERSSTTTTTTSSIISRSSKSRRSKPEQHVLDELHQIRRLMENFTSILSQNAGQIFHPTPNYYPGGPNRPQTIPTTKPKLDEKTSAAYVNVIENINQILKDRSSPDQDKLLKPSQINQKFKMTYQTRSNLNPTNSIPLAPPIPNRLNLSNNPKPVSFIRMHPSLYLFPSFRMSILRSMKDSTIVQARSSNDVPIQRFASRYNRR